MKDSLSTDDSYYNKTWNEPDNHGTTFFKHVDFTAPNYKYQEQIFREYIKGLKKNIKSVLELGAGTGRMTKIMLEELPNMDSYNAIDISKKNIQSIEKLYKLYKNIDFSAADFEIIEFSDICIGHGWNFDLVLASEVLMHIKPEDIDKVIQKLSKIGKQIINIDWTFNPYPSEWCFIHPYHDLYTKYGARPEGIRPMKNINQALFHYRFSN